MEHLMKEMNAKHVGKYHLKAFAHSEDYTKGAMAVYVKNSNEQLHHTGITSKTVAMKLYNSLDTSSKVEKFLRSSQTERAVMTGGFMGAFRNY